MRTTPIALARCVIISISIVAFALPRDEAAASQPANLKKVWFADAPAIEGSASRRAVHAEFPFYFSQEGRVRHLLTIDAAGPIDLPRAVGDGADIQIHNISPESGFVKSIDLGGGDALFVGSAKMQSCDLLRWFLLANPKQAPKKIAKNSSAIIHERLGSIYPLAADGSRLDAYFVRDAKPSGELLPSGEGLSIAGAGDRPRRFMKGHRFEAGDGIVASVRFADGSGGSLRISAVFPARANGHFAVPSKGISVAVNELSPDLEIGRVSERVNGNIAFLPKEDGSAILHLELDAALRRVGVKDPQRLVVFGDFHCVGVALGELTPWLGKFNIGRPVLETFAFPD